MRSFSARILLASVVLLGVGCNRGQAETEDTDGEDTASLSECFEKGTVETCAEVCAATNDVCLPAGCDGATYVLSFSGDACDDPEIGGWVDHPCDEPIDWQPNNFVMCCCAD